MLELELLNHDDEIVVTLSSLLVFLQDLADGMAAKGQGMESAAYSALRQSILKVMVDNEEVV